MSNMDYSAYSDLDLNFTIKSYQVINREDQIKTRYVALCHEIPELKVKGLTPAHIRDNMREACIRQLQTTQVYRSAFYSSKDRLRYTAKVKNGRV